MNRTRGLFNGVIKIIVGRVRNSFLFERFKIWGGEGKVEILR